MMINMGLRKKLISCFDICSQTSRESAVKSIFEMLTEIMMEEEENLQVIIDQQGPNSVIDRIRHCVGFLISAMDCLQAAYHNFEPFYPDTEKDEDGIPF